MSGGINNRGTAPLGDEGTLHVEATSGGMDALVFNTGVVTIDTTQANVIHSGGGGLAFGQIEDRIYTDENGVDHTYSVCTFTFDKISLTGSVLVVLKGNNAVSLRTRNSGDIIIGTNFVADGGKGSADERGPIGKGVLGGGNGGVAYPVKPGEGIGGGPGHRWWGAGGAYGGLGNVNQDPKAQGVVYGDTALTHLLPGSGGGGAYDGRGSGAAGGGAIEFFAHDKGNFVLQQNMSISVNGGSTLGGTGGSGSGGAIRIEAGSVELYGKLSAAGGLPNNIEHAKLGHGGGGRIAVHTNGTLKTSSTYSYDISGYRSGTYGLYGNTGEGGVLQDLNVNGGILTFATDSAAWSHSDGLHGQGILQVYETGDAVIGQHSVAEVQFRSVNIGPLTTVKFEGAYPLSIQAVDTSGTAGMIFTIASDALDKSFKLTGDVTSYLPVDTKISLRGSEFTIGSSKYENGSTSIILDSAHGATVGNTFTVNSTAGFITIGANMIADGPAYHRNDNAGSVGPRGPLGGGYAGNSNPWRTNGTGPGGAQERNNGASGGGHANVGGKGVEATEGGASYGNVGITFLYAGSGGGGAYHSTGGAGGGAISLEADRTLTIQADTTISVNGGSQLPLEYSSAGAGSAGSIRLKGRSIFNYGKLTAKGGTPGSGGRGGAGSDGRISFNYSKDLEKGDVDVGLGTIGTSTVPAITGTFNANGNLSASATWQEFIPPTGFDDMVFWWHFDEGAGKSAIDYSGNGLHGDLQRDAKYQDGKFGKAVYFDGNGDRVRRLYDPRLALTQYTVSLWMKTQKDNDGWAGLFGRSGRIYAIWLNQANHDTGINYIHHRYWDGANTNSGAPNFNGGSRMTHNQWWHIVAWNDGNTSATWINGVKSDTSVVTGGLNNRSSTLWLGGNPESGGNNLKGWVDDVRLYGRALSDTEVLAVYGDGEGDKPKGASVDIFTITGTQNPTSFKATGLPAGIIVDPNTGVIRGTPSTVGTFNVVVTAGNLAGDSAGQALDFTVNPAAPVLTNAAASNIGSNSAIANVTLEKNGGKDPAITVYYGRSDAGTNTDSENGGWTDKVDFGEQPAGSYQIGISGLDKGANYFYRAFATHGIEGVAGTWASASISFTTSTVAGPPLVASSAASNIKGTTADVGGQLLSFDGSDLPTITVYYGTEDKGATTAGWTGSKALGTSDVGVLSGAISGLTPASLYYYRLEAKNAGGSHISDAANFATIGAPIGETRAPSDVSPSSATLNVRVVGTGGFRQELQGTDPLVHDQLRAHWRMDEGTGTKITDDINSYVGNFNGSKPAKWVAGQFGRALEFDTGDNQVVLPLASHPPSSGTELSFAFWTWGADNVIRNTSILGANSTAGRVTNIHFPWGNGRVYWDSGNGSHDRLEKTPNSAWLKGSWSNWVFTKNRTTATMEIYHNGALFATGGNRGRAWGDVNSFKLGTDAGTGSDWPGKIDDFRIYDKALTAEEVTTLWGGGTGDLKGGKIIGEAPTVKIFWGDNDGGDSTTADLADDAKWDHEVTVAGTHELLAVASAQVTGLTNGTKYYYRGQVTNSSGTAWAGATRSFTATNTLLNTQTIDGLALWLDATDVDGDSKPDLHEDGTALSAWSDISGNSVEVLQATTSSKPVYMSQQAGTKAGVLFDGTGDFMYVMGALDEDGGDSSIYVVHQRKVESGSDGGIIVDEYTADIPSNGKMPYDIKVSSLQQVGATLKNIKIGKDATVSTLNFGGLIHELLVFKQKLSISDHKMVEGYLAHKWGATDALVNTHPYKDEAPSFDNSPKLTLAIGAEGFDSPTRTGLLGEWLFDDGTANDTSGNDLHGTNNGGVFVEETWNGSGKAVNLNSNKWINVDDSANRQQTFDTGRALTVSFWAKEWPDGGWEPYISKRGESQGWQIRRRGSSGVNLAMTLRGPGNDDWYVAKDINDNEWHHIAATFGDGKRRIYIDGVKLGEENRGGSIRATGSQLVFGARDNSGSADNAPNIGNHSATYLDDIRIYNRSITADEVSVLSGSFVNKIIGYYGNVFSHQILSTKGPEAFEVSGGALPPGLTIANTGIISGTPTQTGDFEATIKASNTSGSDSRKYFFRIRQGLQNITFDQDFGSKKYGDTEFALSATSSAGTAVTYYSKNEDVLKVTGNAVISPTVTEGLTVHWRLDETSGTSAPDPLSGNNGTLKNMNDADWVDGKFAKALDFDGSDDYVFAPKTVGGERSMTAAMWIKTPTVADDTFVAKVHNDKNESNQDIKTGKGWAIKTRANGEVWFRVGSRRHADDRTRSVAGVLQANTWTHIAVTWANRKATLYINGLPVLSRTTYSGRTVFEDTEELWLGRSQRHATTQKFKGQIDDFRYYNRALSTDEVFILSGANSDYLTTYDGGKAEVIGSGPATLVAFAGATANLVASTPVERIINVGKSMLTVSADSYTRKVNVANPSFTVQYSGFVNGDDKTALTQEATATTVATTESVAGAYPIVPANATADNYAFTYVNGTLTVDQRTEQVITFNQDFSNVKYGDTVELTATAGSNLPVTYAIDNQNVAATIATRQFHMVGWWKLDETSGTTATDSSGNDRSLVLAGTDGSTNWKVAQFNNGLEFDGTDDYTVNFGNQGILGAEKRSVSFWIKGTATGNDGAGIVGWGLDAAGGHFSVELSAGKVKVDYNGASKTGTTNVLDDQFHNVVVVYPKDGSVGSTKIYVDGSDDGGSASGSATVNTQAGSSLTIARHVKTKKYFKGMLDDVRVYAGELKTNNETEPVNEIAAIYNSGSGDFNKIRVVGTGAVTITASQAGSTNFAPAVPVSQQFEIGKLDQSIAFSVLPEKSVGDFDFDPGAVAGSGLPVHYVSSDPLVASVVGDLGSEKIRIRGAGTTFITATQTGDSTYNAATDVKQVLSVNYYNLFPDSIQGMQFWYDADDVNADRNPDTNAADSVVSTWADRSGNNFNAIQGTVDKLVKYKKGSLSGKSTIAIENGKTLTLPDINGTAMIFMVVKQDPAQSAATKLFGGNIITTNAFGKASQSVEGAYDLASSVSSHQFNVVTMRVAAGNQGFWVNGNFVGGDVNNAGPGTLSFIGNGFQGEIAEIVGYTAALPNLTRMKIEGYLASKWGLLGNLPEDHPHKLSRPTFGGAQNIVFQPLPDKTPESAPFRLVAESSSGLPVSFSSSDISIASVSGDIVTVKAEGTVTITASQSGDSNWFQATDATQQLKVTPKPRLDQVITFDPIADKQIGDAAFDLTASSNSGLALTYTSSNQAVATVEGNKVTIVGQGVTVIRASQDGDRDWNPAQMVEQELKVIKRSQAITFSALPNLKLSQGVYILSATADSGLPVAFAVDNSSVATVQGNQLTLLAGGTAKVTASQGGDISYNPADPVTQTLTVQDDTLKPQTITFSQNLSGKSFGSPPFNLTATVDSGLALTYSSSNPAIATIEGAKLTIKGAGSVTITVEQPGNDSWQAAVATKEMTVSKANQSITFPNIANKAVGDLDFNPGATASSGLGITYTSSDTSVAVVSGQKIQIKGGGSVTITAAQSGDDRYNAATSVSKSFNVTLSNLFADSYPGLKIWLDATDINADGLPDTLSDFLGGGKAKSWNDRSGNNMDTTQSDLTKMPVYKPNTLNGKAVLEFSNSLLDMPNLGLTGSANRSVFIVGKADAPGSFVSFGKKEVTQQLSLGRDFRSEKFMLDIYGLGGQYVGAANVNSMTIVRAVLNGSAISDFTFGMNGVVENGRGKAVINTIESGFNRVGGTVDGLGGLTGQIAEVLVYDSAVTDRMAQKIEGYLARKWGMTGSLATGHPYKSAIPTFGGSQTITFPSVGSPVVSDATIDFKAYSDSGMPITYTSSDTSVLTISGSVGTIQKGGTVTVTASIGADKYYTAAVDKKQTFTISKEDQTIFFAELGDRNKYDPPFLLQGSSSSGLALTYTVDSGPAAIKSGTTDTIELSGVEGTVTVTASQAGNDAYNVATSVTRSFIVNNQEVQTITFKGKGEDGTGLRDIILGYRPFLLPLDGISGGDSGQPVSVEITGGTASSGTAAKVVVLKDKRFLAIKSNASGTLELTASQDGGTKFDPTQGKDVIYNAATSVTQTFNIMAPSKANFKLMMREHGDYTARFNKFKTKYESRTNPDTGFTYTTSEITTLFEGDDGDPDGDGVPNLLEYAFGGESLSQDDDERKNLPRKKPLRRPSSGSANFQMTFVRRTSSSDSALTYTVETSNDMRSWSSSGVTQVGSAEDVGGGMERVIYKVDKAYTDADAPRNQFLRLDVTSSE